MLRNADRRARQDPRENRGPGNSLRVREAGGLEWFFPNLLLFIPLLPPRLLPRFCGSGPILAVLVLPLPFSFALRRALCLSLWANRVTVWAIRAHITVKVRGPIEPAGNGRFIAIRSLLRLRH